MKFEDWQLRNYKYIFDEYFEKQLLGNQAAVLTCECCKYQCHTVLEDVAIPASPAGPGGDYTLCIYCTIQFLSEADCALNEYYSQLM